MNGPFFSDRSRLEYLASKLTQQWVMDYMHPTLSYHGRIIVRDLDILLDHIEGTMNIVAFKFTNPELQASYEELNEMIIKLDSFISEHFSPTNRWPVVKGEEFKEEYALYPMVTKNTQEERDFYEKWQSEMEILGTAFARAYYKLITTGSRVLSEDKPALLYASESDKPSIAGRTLILESGASIELTPAETKLLQLLLAQPKESTEVSHEYGLVTKDRLMEAFKTKRSYEGIRARLLSKDSVKDKLILDIVKGTEINKKRVHMSGYRLVAYRPQKMSDLEKT